MFEDRVMVLNENEAFYEENECEKKIYTVEEIQNILEVNKTAAYDLVKSRAFHSVKVGNHFRISKKSFNKWLNGGEGIE